MIEDLCAVCKIELSQMTLDHWRSARDICALHDYPDTKAGAQMMPFNDPTEM
jgi:hypothetical protein